MEAEVRGLAWAVSDLGSHLGIFENAFLKIIQAFFCFFLVVVLGLARQALYHLSCSSSPNTNFKVASWVNFSESKGGVSATLADYLRKYLVVSVLPVMMG
jgi:hypothetical protein